MQKGLLELVLKRRMTVQADLPLRPGLQPELILLGLRERGGAEGERRGERQEQPVAYGHLFFFHRFSPAK